MEYHYIKSLHIIFVVTWFAGLFYLPRLMVYAAEASRMSDEHAKTVLLNQYQLMQKRLLFGIMWPSAILTLIFGGRLFMLLSLTGWLRVKLIFVLLLYCYHISLHIIFKQQQKNNFRFSGQQLRMWNEIPTVILFAIVFIVVFKNTSSIWIGMAGLLILILLLLLSIRLYKKWRLKNK